tara:strand:+ start:462 stop:623 length:162 start_codon:yes stop_codon:yes gene_type:complete
MKTFQQFQEQVFPKKPKYERGITGKKLFVMPLDLRSTERKMQNIRAQTGLKFD